MTHPVPVIRGRYRRPGQPGRPPKSGSRALARHLAAGTLDGRTWIARSLKDIRDDLAADRGCFRPNDDLDEARKCHERTCAHLGAAERILIDRCAALSVIVQSLEHWIFTQPGMIAPTGELLSVLQRGYATHTANLGRMLVALGLKADRSDRVPSLDVYLRGKANGNGHADSTATVTELQSPAPPLHATPVADAETPAGSRRRNGDVS